MEVARDLVSAHLNALTQTLGAVEAQVASVKNVLALIQGGQPAPTQAALPLGAAFGAPSIQADPFGVFGQAQAAPAAIQADPFGSFGGFGQAQAAGAAPSQPDPKEALNTAMKNACKFVLEKAQGKYSAVDARKVVTEAVTKKFGVKNMKSLGLDKYSEAIAYINASMK